MKRNDTFCSFTIKFAPLTRRSALARHLIKNTARTSLSLISLLEVVVVDVYLEPLIGRVFTPTMNTPMIASSSLFSLSQLGMYLAVTFQMSPAGV